MPCRDYESNWGDSGRVNDSEFKKLKAQNDRLARIACKAMDELVKNGVADFILLKDDEVREWWTAHQIADAKAAAERKAKRDAAAKKKAALAKLTTEEKKLLGIK